MRFQPSINPNPPNALLIAVNYTSVLNLFISRSLYVKLCPNCSWSRENVLRKKAFQDNLKLKNKFSKQKVVLFRSCPFNLIFFPSLKFRTFNFLEFCEQPPPPSIQHVEVERIQVPTPHHLNLNNLNFWPSSTPTTANSQQPQQQQQTTAGAVLLHVPLLLVVLCSYHCYQPWRPCQSSLLALFFGWSSAAFIL